MRSCEIHGAALFGHKIGGNVMNLGLNLSAVSSFWQLAQRRACQQMGRHATETVTLDITSFAGGGSLGRSGGRSVGRAVGRASCRCFRWRRRFFFLFLVFGLSSEVRTKQREHVSLESFAILRPSRAKEAQLCFRFKIYGRLGLKLQTQGTWCSGITSTLHAEGPGLNPQCVQALSQGCQGLKAQL